MPGPGVGGGGGPVVGEVGEDGVAYPIPQPPSDDMRIIFGDDIAADVSAVVFTRQRWANSWTQDDTLVCTFVSWAAAPTVPTAVLHYRYGRVVEIGATSETTRAKKSLGGYYVKIEVTCPDGVRKWVGFVDDVGDVQDGYVARIDASGETPVTVQDPCGTQTFSCVGIIEAFNRDQIHTTYFHAITANETISGTNTAIALSPPFFNPTRETRNRFNATRTVPNFTASASVPNRSTYVFHAYDIYSQTVIEGDRWSTKDIVEYLCCYGTPRDYQNKERIPLWLYIADGKPNPLPDYDEPQLDCEGLTLRQALDKLLNDSKSLGYWTWYDDTSNRVYLEPYTLAESDYTVGSSEINANGRQIDILSSDPATSFTVQKKESDYANQVVIRGARRQVVATLAMKINVLDKFVPAWDASLEAEFAAEVATLDPDVLEDLHQLRDLRSQGKWRAIDRNFKLNPVWDFKTRTATFGVFEDMFEAEDDFTKTFAAGARYLPFPYRMRLLDRLPLKQDVNYAQSGDLLEPHKNSRAPYRDLAAYGFKHGDGWDGNIPSGPPVCWSNKGKRHVLYSDTDPDYELSIRPFRGDGDPTSTAKKDRQLAWGIEIDVNGAFQGVLGTDAAIGSGDAAPHIPRLPINTVMLTVCFEDDRRITEVYPATAPSGVDSVRRKCFDFENRFQVIEILPLTVVDSKIDPATGQITQTLSRKFIRDDRAEMLELAQQVSRYYSTPRNVLRGSSRRCTAWLWPGMLVKKSNPSTAHESTVNCVVTEVSIAMPIGTAQPAKPIFQFVTQRGELDPLAYLPEIR